MAGGAEVDVADVFGGAVLSTRGGRGLSCTACVHGVGGDDPSPGLVLLAFKLVGA